MLQTAVHMACSAVQYYTAFACYYWLQLPIDKCFVLQSNPVAQVHLFTLSKQLLLWNAPHYRSATFADDLRDNLKNVALPGTGVPLSLFCYSRLMALMFVLVVCPVACLAAAAYLVLHDLGTSVNSSGSRDKGLAVTFRELLLEPQHWFAIWRHNCVLMGWHALATGSSSYKLEDKGTFLLEGDMLGLPVSPFYRDAKVFVKHKSVEGGMGIHVYRNFAEGGDWIIQKALRNSEQIAQMLPADAPLSTVRVVTASVAWLQAEHSNRGMSTLPERSSSAWTLHERRNGCSHVAEGQLPACASARPAMHHSSSQQAPDTPGTPADQELHNQRTAVTPAFLPSAGVMRLLHTESRSGQPTQFADAVTSLRQQGMADPALQPTDSSTNGDTYAVQPLLPKFGWWGQQPALLHHPVSQITPCRARQEEAEQQQSSQMLPEVNMIGPEAEMRNCTAATCAVVTAVWRAGLAGADTDHSSICYNIDTQCGMLSPGLTANHWYKLGLSGVGRVDAAASRMWTHHPDSKQQVAGSAIHGLADVLNAVMAAHKLAAPDLPLMGWDVALTTDGVFLLEVNLSMNFFNGAFDKGGYYKLLHHHLVALSNRSAADMACQAN